MHYKAAQGIWELRLKREVEEEEARNYFVCYGSSIILFTCGSTALSVNLFFVQDLFLTCGLQITTNDHM